MTVSVGNCQAAPPAPTPPPPIPEFRSINREISADAPDTIEVDASEFAGAFPIVPSSVAGIDPNLLASTPQLQANLEIRWQALVDGLTNAAVDADGVVQCAHGAHDILVMTASPTIRAARMQQLRSLSPSVAAVVVNLDRGVPDRGDGSGTVHQPTVRNISPRFFTPRSANPQSRGGPMWDRNELIPTLRILLRHNWPLIQNFNASALDGALNMMTMQQGLQDTPFIWDRPVRPESHAGELGWRPVCLAIRNCIVSHVPLLDLQAAYLPFTQGERDPHTLFNILLDLFERHNHYRFAPILGPASSNVTTNVSSLLTGDALPDEVDATIQTLR